MLSRWLLPHSAYRQIAIKQAITTASEAAAAAAAAKLPSVPARPQFQPRALRILLCKRPRQQATGHSLGVCGLQFSGMGGLTEPVSEKTRTAMVQLYDR